MTGIILLVSCINFSFVLVGYFMARTLQCDNVEGKETFVTKLKKDKYKDEEVFIPED